MSLIKMASNPDAKIIISKLPLQTKKRKRKPIIPNVDKVDRIRVLSHSETHVTIECRLLFKNEKPITDVQIQISLPRRKSIENRILNQNVGTKPKKLKPEKLKKEVDKWIRKYIKAKIKRHWKKSKPSRQELFVNEDIGDLS